MGRGVCAALGLAARKTAGLGCVNTLARIVEPWGSAFASASAYFCAGLAHMSCLLFVLSGRCLGRFWAQISLILPLPTCLPALLHGALPVLSPIQRPGG